jgi:hypothetical protein
MLNLMVSLVKWGLYGKDWTKLIHWKSHPPKHLFNIHGRKKTNEGHLVLNFQTICVKQAMFGGGIKWMNFIILNPIII